MSTMYRISNRIKIGLPISSILISSVLAQQVPNFSTRNEVASQESHGKTKSQIPLNLAHLPLAFEQNEGQANSSVRFISRTSKGTVFLTDHGSVLALAIANRKLRPATSPLQLRGANCARMVYLHTSLLGAQPPTKCLGESKLSGVSNYFKGGQIGRSISSVPTFRRARFENVYPGIDMAYYGNEDARLEYDFIVKPGGSPRLIQLGFEGATSTRLCSDGTLSMQTAAGEVCWKRPFTYQVVGGRRAVVACNYQLMGSAQHPRVAFRLGHYDTSRPLVIDPVLQYSTFLGGTLGESGNAITVDGSGNAYVTGVSYSPSDFPTSASTKPTSINGFVFVTKIKPDGTGYVYSSYLSGSGQFGECGNAIAVDGTQNAYVTGYTTSANLPVTPGAFQSTNLDYADGNAFVMKVNPDGKSLGYLTYLGGSGLTVGDAIAVNAAGNAYVAGYTYAPDLYTSSSAFQKADKGFVPNTSNPSNSLNVSCNAFVTELNPTGTNVVYQTYLGGSGSNLAKDTTKNGAAPYVGDVATGIALDSSGTKAYVTGYTYSSDFPTTSGAFQKSLNSIAVRDSACNAFVTELNSTGKAPLLYSTVLGGSGGSPSTYAPGYLAQGDFSTGVAIDASGAIYVAGYTFSSDFPTSVSGYQTTNNGAIAANVCNAFVAKLNPTASSSASQLAYSTYLGGDGQLGDAASGIGLDAAGNAYITGFTSSTWSSSANGFPVTLKPYQKNNNNPQVGNAFITKLSSDGTKLGYSTYFGGSYSASPQSLSGLYGDCGNAIAVTPMGDVFVTGYASSSEASFPVSASAFQRTNTSISTIYGNDYGTAFVSRLSLGSIGASGLDIKSVSVAPTSVVGGNSATYTVTLNDVAPAGGYSIKLGSSSPGATIQPSATVVAGNNSVKVNVVTTPVVNDIKLRIGATANDNIVGANLTVTSPQLVSLSLIPTSVKGGSQNSVGTVTLSGTAPAGGTVLSLSSAYLAAAVVPPSVTVGAGLNVATFVVKSVKVSKLTTVVITVKLNKIIKTATLTVTP